MHQITSSWNAYSYVTSPSYKWCFWNSNTVLIAELKMIQSAIVYYRCNMCC